jgi:hypothetical protein
MCVILSKAKDPLSKAKPKERFFAASVLKMARQQNFLQAIQGRKAEQALVS